MDYALRVYTRARSLRSRVTYVRLSRVQNTTRGGAYAGANRWTAPCFPARTSYTFVRWLHLRRNITLSEFTLCLRPRIPRIQDESGRIGLRSRGENRTSSSKMWAFETNSELESYTTFLKLQMRWNGHLFNLETKMILIKILKIWRHWRLIKNYSVKSGSANRWLFMYMPFQYLFKMRM